jgi:hypothetical protein
MSAIRVEREYRDFSCTCWSLILTVILEALGLKTHQSRAITILRGEISIVDIPEMPFHLEIKKNHRKHLLMDYIASLPMEIFLQILEYLRSSRDLSSFTRCARYICWRASQWLFDFTFAVCCKLRRRELVFQRFTFRAIGLDSQRMMQWLIYHELSRELNGLVLPSLFLPQYFVLTSIL